MSAGSARMARVPAAQSTRNGGDSLSDTVGGRAAESGARGSHNGAHQRRGNHLPRGVLGSDDQAVAGVDTSEHGRSCVRGGRVLVVHDGLAHEAHVVSGLA